MARALALLAVAVCLGLATAGRTTPIRNPVSEFAEKPNAAGHKWGVLIAGSASWGNYRHQADIYHAYQILKRGGLSDDRIIVFHKDDIANNPSNPHPGIVINIPGGDDVYAGVPKDYTGSDVTAEIVLAVLAGDKTKVAQTSGSQKVLGSTSDDEVFIYYADHGGPGLLGMPSPPYLYAHDLVGTLKDLATNNKFETMTVYIEACESGSIFDGLLPDNINIYATTAANPSESSWGYYCPGQKIPPPSEYNTCLGDLYSIAFLENSDIEDLNEETLLKQYQLIKDRTSQNGTYAQGSHVMQYGQTSIDSYMVAHYLGTGNTGGNPPEVHRFHEIMADYHNDVHVSSRDAELVPLIQDFLRAQDPAKKAAASATLQAELSARDTLDKLVQAAATTALSTSNSLLASSPMDTLTAVRPAGQPLVDDWDCFKGMVEGWGEACGYLSQYGMKHGRVFANLCNAGITPQVLIASAKGHCAAQETSPLVKSA